MKLNVITRLSLLSNLPEQGSLEQMLNKRNVRNKITFSSEELEKMNLETSEQGIKWLPIDDIDVDFTNTELKYLKGVIGTLSEKGLINEGIVDFAIEVTDIVGNMENSNKAE